MYSYTQHTASRQIFVDAPFACAACGFQAECRAYAKGKGHARSSGWGANPGAARDAEAEALHKAHASAKLMLELAPCPRCSKRNAVAVARWRMRLVVTSMVGVLVALALAAGAVFAYGGYHTTMALGSAALSALVALGVLGAVASSLGDWLGAARNVQIAPPRPGQFYQSA